MNLRTQMAVLSALVMAAVLLLSYAILLYFYGQGIRQNLDRQLQAEAQRLHRNVSISANGKLALDASLGQTALNYQQHTNAHYLIRTGDNRPVWRSPNMIAIEPPQPQFSAGQSAYWRDFTFAGRPYRLYNAQFQRDAKPVIIQTLRPLTPYLDDIASMRHLLYILFPLPVLLIGAAGWAIAAFSLRPVNELIKSVNRIHADNLTTRLPERRKDEVGRLSHVFNVFLRRIDDAFQSLKRFTADASHELRTPLTAIRTRSEVVLSKPRHETQYREALAEVLEEVDRLEKLVDTLLQLARGDAGILEVRLKQENISVMLQNWLDFFGPLAEDKALKIHTDIESDIHAMVDASLLETMVLNIYRNAVQYTPGDGRIDIALSRQQQQCRFTVCDSGPGITGQDKDRVFERFVRLNTTRHQSEGAGLGLSLAKWAAQQHQGDLFVEDNPAGGACFIAVWPYAGPT